ncbi:Pre-mRNA-splicing factor SYF1 [Carpediemonas membranifera]|uniref:Pre-mRNA-splicing factor SYF1 n=1 Tax=Carpediemonas membranifera TaxID=201153 RepID=A0A8J6AXJ8_9EUKA|nr:Pre-mRNA-splicing factor SYF1 [Carpediemonas membranifera]|eukprot:KAG9390858.1 Pre-mRNA-splicing factor SYF1 [Carpediemonas membranifera]
MDTLEHWTSELSLARDALSSDRFSIYEEAVLHIPRSYKMWYAYIHERRAYTDSVEPEQRERAVIEMCVVYERALIPLKTMPRLWEDYLEYLTSQMRVSKTRKTFDKALKQLPLTLHYRIWPLYIAFATQSFVPGRTALSVLNRHLLFDPGHREHLIQYLLRAEHWPEAVSAIHTALEDPEFRPESGRTRFDFITEIMETVAAHPDAAGDLDVDGFAADVIRRFPTGAGPIVVSLAQYHKNSGSFARAREVCLDAFKTVSTVSDFATIFDYFGDMELTRLQTEAEAHDPSIIDEYGLRVLQQVIEQAPAMLYAVRLNQNPNSVALWVGKVQVSPDPAQCIKDAIEVVDPNTAGVVQLFKEATRIMTREESLELMQFGLDRGGLQTEDYVALVAARAELQLLSGVDPERALLDLAPRLVADGRLHALHCDLTYTLFIDDRRAASDVRAAFEAAMEAEPAPLTFFSYARFEEEQADWGRVFKIWSRAVAAVQYPAKNDVIKAYVQALSRCPSFDHERVRMVLDQAASTAPPKHAPIVHFMAAEFEKRHGLRRRAGEAMAAIGRKTPAPLIADVALLAGAMLLWTDAVQSCEVLLAAVNRSNTPRKDLPRLALALAHLLAARGDSNGGRTVLLAVSKHVNPSEDPTGFWDDWFEYEGDYGTEATIRDAVQTKRDVQTLEWGDEADQTQPDLYTAGVDEEVQKETDRMAPASSKITIEMTAVDRLAADDFVREKDGSR